MNPDLNAIQVFARRSLKEQARIRLWKLRSRRTDVSLPPPIFLLGCPRSGTSLVFDVLRRHPDLGSLDHEGHEIWDAFHHPRRHGWRSDALDESDVRDGDREYVDAALRHIGTGQRVIDKTPKNVLRVRYLRELYPDAKIVLLVRDGRSTVNSLLEGWRARRGISYLLPQTLELGEYRGRFWSYVLPPDWRHLHGTDLATACTAQYVAASEAAFRDMSLVDIVLRYEELLRDPMGVMHGLLRDLSLEPSPAVDDVTHRLDQHHVGSVTPPRHEKWRENLPALQPHLPVIEAQMARLGYELL